MTNKSEWSGAVGRSWANEWTRTDRSFAALTERLLARIAALPGTHVLDIGCGAGELALAIARARPGANVLGADVSPELVAAARARSHGVPKLGFETADVTAWSGPGLAPDLLVSRHGVMFFDDPVAAFAALAALAAPRAHLVFSCFGPFRENPWASDVAAVIAPGRSVAPDPLAPGPFAFADPARVCAILEAAGWTDAAYEAVGFDYVAGEGADPVADALAFFRRIGPAAPGLRAMPEDERAGAELRLRALLERHRIGSRVIFAAQAWIVSARGPGEAT